MGSEHYEMTSESTKPGAYTLDLSRTKLISDRLAELLIDSWRQMDELHKVKLTLMVDFDPEAVNGMAPFEEYVREADVNGLLPDRWTEDNMEACIKYSVETTN
jgi:hypothetical protein